MTCDATPLNAGRPPQPGFSAILHPHRSLSPRGFLVLMGLLGGVSFLAGLLFLSIGAWPVMGFFGLDVAIIYLAFRLNYRSGRLFERVELTSDRLTLTRVHPSGRAEVFEFNPYFVRLRLGERPDGRTDLRLAQGPSEWPFGCFLTDDERRDFARHLTTALNEARGGVRI